MFRGLNVIRVYNTTACFRNRLSFSFFQYLPNFFPDRAGYIWLKSDFYDQDFPVRANEKHGGNRRYREYRFGCLYDI